jgi:hypothetical protein
MTIDWLILGVALGALAFPLPAFFSRKNSFRALAELDIERRNGSWWLVWRKVLRFPGHWLELARGFAGAAAALATIDHLEAAWALYAEHASWGRFVLPLAAALLSVILGALLFRSPGKSLAPIFFVGSTLLILLPPAVAIPALLLALSSAFAFKSLPAYFVTLGPAVALLGFVFDPGLWPSLTGALLAVAPLILAAARQHELVIPIRRGRSS